MKKCTINGARLNKKFTDDAIYYIRQNKKIL